MPCRNYGGEVEVETKMGMQVERSKGEWRLEEKLRREHQQQSSATAVVRKPLHRNVAHTEGELACYIGR